MEPLEETPLGHLSQSAAHDYELVQKALRGEQSAFAELMRKYNEKIYFTMLRMCSNKDDADDLTIEAFGKAFKNLKQYRPQFAFTTWLFKIATNNAIDFLHRRKQLSASSLHRKNPAQPEEEYEMEIHSSGLDPEETYIKKQNASKLRILVNSLKPKFKELVELFYFQEMTHDELCRKLNMSLGSVKIELFRARELLYHALKGAEDYKTQIILKYFPDLTLEQVALYEKMQELYEFWNRKINLVSRKDIHSLYEKHILHSLAIARIISFKEHTRILDIGTGGGFPGIPLAIMFPDCRFTLVDSVAKKIKAVEAISKALGLQNVVPIQGRAEDIKSKYHFVLSRAVTEFPELYQWSKGKMMKENFNDLTNGIICLKGGDLKKEMGKFYSTAKIFELKNYFEEDFFETKKAVYYNMN